MDDAAGRHSDSILQDDLNSILHRLGYSDWKNSQLPAIESLCNGTDTICTLPPGSGKSLIYQVSGLYKAMNRKAITFIVSPLISLVKEQATSLLEKGIYAVPLYFSKETYFDQYKCLTKNDYPPVFIFITPERLAMEEWNGLICELYHEQRLGLFVLDEAQVILEWGMTYRTEYKCLNKLKKMFPDVPILALSGSMSKKCLQDTIEFLGMRNYNIVSHNPDRPNVHYRIVPASRDTDQRDAEVIKFLQENRKKNPNDSGIVYCRTPRGCVRLRDKLKALGIPTVCYTGKGMTQTNRSWAYQLWKQNYVRIVIATVAFSMGIDKEDVRFVLHRDLPKNLSAYIQETGRAGRDGKPARCILYYTYSDSHRNISMNLQNPLLNKGFLNETIIPSSQELLRMCEDHKTCRREYILGHYGLPSKRYCNNCDNCDYTRTDSAFAQVRKTFIKDIIEEYRFLRKKRNDGPEHRGKAKVTITQLAEAVARQPLSRFRPMLNIDPEDLDVLKWCKKRQNVSKNVVHNLILQGMFEEYYVKVTGEHTRYIFYLRLRDIECARSSFSVLL